MKLWDQAGPRQGAASLHFIHPVAPLLPIPVLSLSVSPSTRPSTAPAFPPPRIGRASPPAILTPAVLLLPFFFIKLPSGRAGWDGPWRGTQLADPAVLLNDNMARAQLARRSCSFMTAARPGSNDILSVAEGAIGKQRLKMNYSVSSSSLMNK